MLNGSEIIINGDGKQERDYLYVDDVVKANLNALTKADGNIYNLGTGITTNVIEIFSYLKEITGYKLKPLFGPAKKGEVNRSCLSIEKIKKSWDWKPEYTISQGLENTVRFIEENEI